MYHHLWPEEGRERSQSSSLFWLVLRVLSVCDVFPFSGHPSACSVFQWSSFSSSRHCLGLLHSCLITVSSWPLTLIHMCPGVCSRGIWCWWQSSTKVGLHPSSSPTCSHPSWAYWARMCLSLLHIPGVFPPFPTSGAAAFLMSREDLIFVGTFLMQSSRCDSYRIRLQLQPAAWLPWIQPIKSHGEYSTPCRGHVTSKTKILTGSKFHGASSSDPYWFGSILECLPVSVCCF